MRLAFWRADKVKSAVQRAVPHKPAPAVTYEPVAAPAAPGAFVAPAVTDNGDLDLRALGQALVRKRGWIIVPTALALVLSVTAVNLITPRYKSEARILIDGRESVFLRPSGERNEERTALDPEAVTSQVHSRPSSVTGGR